LQFAICNSFLLLLLLASLAGCAGDLKSHVDMDAKFVNPARMDKGLVVILPGIEGESPANQDIRKGLDEGGIPYALAIYRWGFPIPGLGLLINQTDTAGNRRAAKELAGGILKYQANHPDRPVFLVGHSAGGGVAVFTLEALADLPAAKPVAGAMLLSSSISADYPLDKALKMTRLGIVNGFNPDDTVLLGAGTAMFGNVDGEHGDSAGRTGFQLVYPGRLFQFKVNSGDVKVHGDPHFVITDADLIAQHAPRWVLANAWPPARRSP
jgi:pimeloyl-ACP methyl ester carboxylesterase